MNKNILVVMITILALSVFFSGCNEQNQSSIQFINKPLFEIAVNFEEIDNRYQTEEVIYKIEDVNSRILGDKNIDIFELYSINYSSSIWPTFINEILLRFKSKDEGCQAYDSIIQNYSYDFPQIKGEIFGDESYIGKNTKLLFGTYIDIYLLVFRFKDIIVFLSGIVSYQHEIHNYGRLIENNLKESVLTIESEEKDFKILSNKYSMVQIDSNLSKGFVPLSASFDIDLIGREKISDSFYWYFDDGNTSTGKITTNIFTESGVYEVVLIVPNDQGIFYKDTLTIVAEEPPVFELQSWETIDNNGYAALQINCKIRKPVDLKIKNPMNTTTDILYEIDKETKINTINLVSDLYGTPMSGQYSLIVEESSSSKIVYQKNITFQGPIINMKDCASFDWETIQYWETWDSLNSFYITIENTGDLPAYPYKIKCIIDDADITSYAYLENDIISKVIFPGEIINEIYCYCYDCYTVEHSVVHVVKITLQDFYGNDISHSFETISYT